MKTSLSLTIICAISLHGLAQDKQIYKLDYLLKNKRITVVNRTATSSDSSRHAIKLSDGSGEGIAWLDGVTFKTGSVEVMLKGKDVMQKSFVGIAFHGINDSTYDAVYFRPFNFHSSDSVRRIHAVQYISHPRFTWKKLREEQNGIYEKALVRPPDPNGWFRAKIEITEKHVTVYVNNDKTPSLSVDKISTITSGKIGLWVGDGADGEFSSLIVVNK